MTLILECVQAVRSLVRAWVFSSSIVLVLALGMGAASAVFYIADAVIFEPGKRDETSRLCLVGANTRLSNFAPYVYDYEFYEYAAHDELFSKIAAIKPSVANLMVGVQVSSANIARVTRNFTELFDDVQILGRGFVPQDFTNRGDNSALISAKFAREKFVDSRQALGHEIRIDDGVYTIVGVISNDLPLPSNFNAEVFLPTTIRPDPLRPLSDISTALAQLKIGVSPEVAAASLQKSKPLLSATYQDLVSDRSVAIVPLKALRSFLRPGFYWMLLGASSALFISSMLNAANLMLVRSLKTKHENSIRIALGAPLPHLARVAAIQGALLSSLAIVIGAALGRWCFPLLMSLVGGAQTTPSVQWAMNYRFLIFLTFLGMISTIVLTAIPALSAITGDLARDLSSSNRQATKNAGRFIAQRTLLVAQIAFSVILVVGAGLMTQSLRRLRAVDIGIESEGRIRVGFSSLQNSKEIDGAKIRILQAIQEKLRTLPGVVAVAYSSDAVLSGNQQSPFSITSVGRPDIYAKIEYASENFNDLVGLRLVLGKWFGPSSTLSQVVISERLAQQCFGSDNPIGRTIRLRQSTQELEVIGVAQNIRQDIRSAGPGQIFLRAEVIPEAISCFWIRTKSPDGVDILPALRGAIYEIEPRLVLNIASVRDSIDRVLQLERYLHSCLMVFSAFSLLMVVAGLSAILTFMVDQRRKEFGIRIAVGSTPASIMALVMGEASKALVIGVTLGMVCSCWVTQGFRAYLFETASFDPLVLSGAVTLFFVAACLCSILPAIRASNTDVISMLRSD